MVFIIPPEHNDKMEALGYRPVGARWYHPERMTILMNGSFTLYDYSAAKEAWIEDEALTVLRFPWEPVVDDEGTVLGVKLVNGWMLGLEETPRIFDFDAEFDNNG